MKVSQYVATAERPWRNLAHFKMHIPETIPNTSLHRVMAATKPMKDFAFCGGEKHAFKCPRNFFHRITKEWWKWRRIAERLYKKKPPAPRFTHIQLKCGNLKAAAWNVDWLGKTTCGESSKQYSQQGTSDLLQRNLLSVTQTKKRNRFFSTQSQRDFQAAAKPHYCMIGTKILILKRLSEIT